MKTFLLTLIVPLAAISTIAYSEEIIPIRLLKTEGNIVFYENISNKKITSIQFQLQGKLDSVEEKAGFLYFSFNGHIKQQISMVELFNPHGNAQILDFEVRELPVKIKKWTQDDAITWIPSARSFDDVLKSAKEAQENHLPIAAGVKSIKFLFFENGDLLGLEGEQIQFAPEDK